jgi:hypothetical protein
MQWNAKKWEPVPGTCLFFCLGKSAPASLGQSSPLPVRGTPNDRLDLAPVAALPGGAGRAAALQDDALKLHALGRGMWRRSSKKNMCKLKPRLGDRVTLSATSNYKGPMSRALHRHIVARARQIIGDPGQWTTRDLARSTVGVPVDPTDDAARRFCAVGALQRAAAELVGDTMDAQILAYESQTAVLEFTGLPEGQTTLEVINDEQGHEAVLDLFGRYLTIH